MNYGRLGVSEGSGDELLLLCAMHALFPCKSFLCFRLPNFVWYNHLFDLHPTIPFLSLSGFPNQSRCAIRSDCSHPLHHCSPYCLSSPSLSLSLYRNTRIIFGTTTVRRANAPPTPRTAALRSSSRNRALATITVCHCVSRGSMTGLLLYCLGEGA